MRYHHEKHIQVRRARLARSIFGIERPDGAFRKRRALDCGKPRCQCCHSEKYPKRQPTKQEILAVQNLHGFGFDSTLLLGMYPSHPGGVAVAASGSGSFDYT